MVVTLYMVVCSLDFLRQRYFAGLPKRHSGRVPILRVPEYFWDRAIGAGVNFLIRESFGEYTDLPWAMQIPVSAVRSGEVSGAMRDNLLTINGISYIQVHADFYFMKVCGCLAVISAVDGHAPKKEI